MSTPIDILKQYWGYSAFREKQEEIIDSVLAGKDTLALLPTGGGKSICYQVPGLLLDGVCIVISPLIALMKDQVGQLLARGIDAVALTSDLTYKELGHYLDRAVDGDMKFVYISPERLKNRQIRETIRNMKVNVLAIDEAHCISEWGYDFRPSYLEIAEIREVIPNAPVLGVTATATPDVVIDIQEKLHFPEPNCIRKGFKRDNLAYIVRKTEDKWGKVLEILNNIPGTSIMYVRNRKRTEEIAQFLVQRGISADFYHAGLSNAERAKKQKAWTQNQTRVMIATNAFGMGIDKPDVRTVIHIELPDSPEAYFQEAGRGGRDGKTAYGVIVLGPNDIDELKRKSLDSQLSMDEIRHIYKALCNYGNIPLGSGENAYFDIHLVRFARQLDLKPYDVYRAFEILERQGVLKLSDEFGAQSKLHFTISPRRLYDLQIRNETLETFTKTLLRSYEGLFENYVTINEYDLAKRLQTSVEKIKQLLQNLVKYEIAEYIEAGKDSRVHFLIPRVEEKYLPVSFDYLKKRRLTVEKKVRAIIEYAENERVCRSVYIGAYFGDYQSSPCGICDVCVEKNKSIGDNEKRKRNLITYLNHRIQYEEIDLRQLKTEHPEDTTLLSEVIRELLDDGLIQLKGNSIQKIP
jgi:ATP-dependent DNA helicase RecQ